MRNKSTAFEMIKEDFMSDHEILWSHGADWNTICDILHSLPDMTDDIAIVRALQEGR